MERELTAAPRVGENRRPWPVRVRAPASRGGDTCEGPPRDPDRRRPMTRPARPSFRPAVEALETREVPATLIEVLGIHPGASGDHLPTLTRKGSDLVITGTAGDDSVTVSQVGRGLLRLDLQTGSGPV